MIDENELAAAVAGADQALAAHRDELRSMDLPDAMHDYSHALIAGAEAAHEWTKTIMEFELIPEEARPVYLKAVRLGLKNLQTITGTIVEKLDDEIDDMTS